jgi:hypothetical protein
LSELELSELSEMYSVAVPFSRPSAIGSTRKPRSFSAAICSAILDSIGRGSNATTSRSVTAAASAAYRPTLAPMSSTAPGPATSSAARKHGTDDVS